MTDARVLLVTGSRTLAARLDAADAQAWVCAEIDRAVLAYGIDTIVCGDAAGPDRWTSAYAAQSQRRLAVYEAQSGMVQCSGPRGFGRTTLWNFAIEEVPAARRPLRRNAVMVDHVALRDPQAVVLGFVDASPARKTRGTEHTLDCARERGLTNVTRLLWEGKR